jgi:cbb3-type cytochrome oxidase subunit 1
MDRSAALDRNTTLPLVGSLLVVTPYGIAFLIYSFSETVVAMYPYDVMRAIGGALGLGSALLIAFYITMTISGRSREKASIGGRSPVLRPAE